MCGASPSRSWALAPQPWQRTRVGNGPSPAGTCAVWRSFMGAEDSAGAAPEKRRRAVGGPRKSTPAVSALSSVLIHHGRVQEPGTGEPTRADLDEAQEI